MAVSPTPKLTPANFPSLDALQHLGPFAVALSGGADSTALLVACAMRWPGKVHAVHVHHGLQAAADGFEVHCVTLCERLNVPMVVQRINAARAHRAAQSPAPP